MESSLAVDFYGPIAFRFSEKSDGNGPWAWAYLPVCHYHRCNVLTDTDDKSVDKGNTIMLAGPTAGKTALGKSCDVFSLPWQLVQKPAPGQSDCYLIFQLPLPDYIFGLRPEYAKITEPDGSVHEDNYARGLRLYYNVCTGKPTLKPSVTAKPGDPNDLTTLDPTCFRSDSSADVGFRIEVRYRDLNPVVDDNDRYADAKMCSTSMRNLFPPLDTWTATFDPPGGSNSDLMSFTVPGDPHPVDCGANLILFSDGGLTS